MTNFDFSVKSARDEMRHIVGSSEPDVIIGSLTKIRTGVQKEGQGSHGIPVRTVRSASGARSLLRARADVRSELENEVREKDMADLSMFGLVACDEGGPGFVNASVRTITNARQVRMRMQSKCSGTHRHAVLTRTTQSKRVTNRTGVRQVARAMEEGPTGAEDTRTEEESEGCKEDTRDCSRKRQEQKNGSRAK